MEKRKKNEVTNFMLYVFNRWCIGESIRLFGENLGNHIFEKWMYYGAGNELRWYAELDVNCRQRLVDRANELYNK
jgi:hypothetical protein